ncbi:MAG: 16S rRNA (uracil(1498)-N(3))-methyltransferase [Novosphingobium sp.]|nr:16S rRNA (uracil(1498)-N(3))-methyltransferase [Novosphingobium sp.]
MPAIPAWPPKSAPRLFIDSPLEKDSGVIIAGAQAHYLLRVMRAARGDHVILCDNITGEWAARIDSIGKRDLLATPMQLLRPREEVPDFWLCASLLKKDRFNLLLEKASELGVRRIQPVLARRCVVDGLNPQRAHAILKEAAEQCARTALPELAEPVRLDAMVRQWPGNRTLFFADEAGGELATDAFAANPGPAALLIGPEGGFDDAERLAVRAIPQVRPVSLGPRILRAETAAIAATALWMGIAGDWNK